MDTLKRINKRPSGEVQPGAETRVPAAQEPAPAPSRRPYRKPVPELRGQIKPSLLGSPPLPPA